jgi:hypothetical protein
LLRRSAALFGALLAANVVYCSAQKGGSKDASGRKKGIQGKAQNGKVVAAAAAPRAKRPGLSQSASFPARGTAGAKKAAAVTAPPKQARPEGKGAVPNGSAAAAGSFSACCQVGSDGCCWVYLQSWDGIAGRGTEKKANSAQVPAARRSMVATHSHFVNYWIFSCIVLNLVSFFFGLACEA